MRAALPAVKFGEMWLFFGNRSRDKDFLFEYVALLLLLTTATSWVFLLTT